MVFLVKIRYNINGDMMIKYPNGHRKKVNSRSTKRSTSNRGIALEDDINATNEYYLVHDLAVVHKKPTPIQVVNVNYTDKFNNTVSCLTPIVKWPRLLRHFTRNQVRQIITVCIEDGHLILKQSKRVQQRCSNFL